MQPTAPLMARAASSPSPNQMLGKPHNKQQNKQVVTLFVCANSARGGESPSERNRRPPAVLKLELPYTTYEVVVPCSGRIQPEHVLKAFESGSDAAVVLACEEGNCHYHEGSRRCNRRVEYVSRILEDVGLGARRILLVHLPGSAREDLALSAPGAVATPKQPKNQPDALDPAQLAQIQQQILAHMAALPPDPIHQTIFPETLSSEVDDQDESED